MCLVICVFVFDQMVKWLLEHGADPTSANDLGAIPLHYHKGNLDVAKLLATAAIRHSSSAGEEVSSALGSCLDAQDRNGVTPCHRAVAIGSLDVAQFLVTCGANVNLQVRSLYVCMYVCMYIPLPRGLSVVVPLTVKRMVPAQRVFHVRQCLHTATLSVLW
jgi:ankyrin repeat protein